MAKKWRVLICGSGNRYGPPLHDYNATSALACIYTDEATHFSLYERVRFSLKLEECYHTIIALRFTFFGAVLHDIQGSRQKYAHRVVIRPSTRLTIRREGDRLNMAFQGNAEFGEVEESDVNCY